MRRFLWLALLTLAAAAVAACGGDGNGDGSGLEGLLRRMVLQPEDLPEDFVQAEETFTTNEELAASAADPNARLAELESWGRLLGYELTYQPTGSTDELPQGVNVSASIYKAAEGASASFADAVAKAQETDWATNYAGLREFQQDDIDAEGLAEEIVWLRLSGLQTAGGRESLVTDDLVFFRVGPERGFLRVLATSEGIQNRRYLLGTVGEWLRTLIENVEEAVADPGFDLGEE